MEVSISIVEQSHTK